jgi:hypothetical protein
MARARLQTPPRSVRAASRRSRSFPRIDELVQHKHQAACHQLEQRRLRHDEHGTGTPPEATAPGQAPVAAKGLRYAVDIVSCIDVTGSMSPILDRVKDNALRF